MHSNGLEPLTFGSVERWQLVDNSSSGVPDGIGRAAELPRCGPTEGPAGLRDSIDVSDTHGHAQRKSPLVLPSGLCAVQRLGFARPCSRPSVDRSTARLPGCAAGV